MATALLAMSAFAADFATYWPQWLGQALLLPAWQDEVDDKTVVHKRRVVLEPSYSGPIVAADRLLVTETRGKKPKVLQALSRIDGKVLWTAEWAGAMSIPFFAWEKLEWIRATSAFDGESLSVAGIGSNAAGKKNHQPPDRLSGVPSSKECLLSLATKTVANQ